MVTLEERSARRPTAKVVAVLALVAVGTTGFAVVSRGPGAVLGLSGRRSAAVVPGARGLAPGGAVAAVGLLISGLDPHAGDGRVTALVVDAASLPLACPPDAWNLAATGPVHVADGEDQARVPGAVTLTDDAPAECQGVTVTALTATATVADAGGHAVTAPASVLSPLTVATLGTPGLSVADQGGQVVATVTPDPAAGTGLHYAVETAGGDGRWTAVCQLTDPAPCATGRHTGDGARVRVSVRKGSFWRRTSVELTP